ncbi:hypothetical protein AB832_07605 [Flavobacteriaceae bacterium (ex Bugula neritina AB1)]|nr:hypothetical protein AB832_07605 [Flavobacteriaceae bacterium (ex Bugula neritina AB1)]
MKTKLTKEQTQLYQDFLNMAITDGVYFSTPYWKSLDITYFINTCHQFIHNTIKINGKYIPNFENHIIPSDSMIMNLSSNKAVFTRNGIYLDKYATFGLLLR